MPEIEAKKQTVTAKQRKFIEILKNSLGIVTTSCKKANVSRATYYLWKNGNPEFSKLCDEVIDITVDVVEQSLLNNIIKGDTTAIIFYLKTKGKSRGYVEHVQADINLLSGVGLKIGLGPEEDD